MNSKYVTSCHTFKGSILTSRLILISAKNSKGVEDLINLVVFHLMTSPSAGH